MIRRVGFKQEKRANPNDADGMIRVLRESNLKIPGDQRSGQGQQVGSVKESQVVKNWAIKNGGEGPPRVSDTSAKKTVGDNPAAPSAPKDFLSFDFSKMEHVGNALFHAKDDWRHADEGPAVLRHSSIQSPEQLPVDEWRGKWPSSGNRDRNLCKKPHGNRECFRGNNGRGDTKIFEPVERTRYNTRCEPSRIKPGGSGR